MTRLTAAVTLLALVAPAYGQSVKLPEKLEVKVGRLAAIDVVWEGDDIRYTASGDMDVFREYDPDPAKVRLRILVYSAGTYDLKAIACKGGKLSEFAVCLVVADGVPPGPKPPPPPPPPPEDELTRKLRLAYTVDVNSIKAKPEWVLAVADVFDMVASRLTNYSKVGEVEKVLRESIRDKKIVPEGMMPVLGADLFAALRLEYPDGNVALDKAGMRKTLETFAAALRRAVR